MQKICAVVKQRIDNATGNVVAGEKAYLVAYFPRTKEQMVAIITDNNTNGVTEFTEVVKDHIYTCEMSKQNDERWKLTFIYNEMADRDCFSQNLKDYKAAIQKQAELAVGALVEFDEINWVDKTYF